MNNMDDFELLLKNGNIGIYKKCEVIEIFGFNTTNKKPFNILTLVTFEDTKQINIEGLMTEKLNSFKGVKNLKWGINRKILDIPTIQSFYKILLENKKYCLDKKTESDIGTLNFLSKQFIEIDETLNKIQLNNILKNNFNNGSYILEAFDETKECLQFLIEDTILLNDLSEKVSDLVDIKLANVSDRLGNVIFQFPINIFKLQYLVPNGQNLIQFNFKFHSELSKKLEILVVAENKFDNSILDFNTKTIKNNDSITIDTSENIEYFLIDKKSNLILNKNSLNGIKYMMNTISLVNQQPRCFKIENDDFEVTVHNNTTSFIGGNPNQTTEYTTWINNRKYEHERKELEKSKSFIQYFGNQGEDEKAINDIISLIKTNGDQGVFLWDPYLDAIDIKKLLYHTPTVNVDLKAITGLKQNKDKKKEILKMRNEFESDDINYLSLNLEVRGRINNNGYDFHDRFLLFPLEKPRVWSLGISVNQLGKSHHILQEVKNAQHILNAFNSLWNQLNNKGCLVWKSI